MSSDSSSSIGDHLFNFYPLITPKKNHKKEKDWIKIGSIIAVALGGLIAAFSVLCIMRFLPFDLLGGRVGTAITLIGGAAILVPAAYVLYDRWKNPP